MLLQVHKTIRVIDPNYKIIKLRYNDWGNLQLFQLGTKCFSFVLNVIKCCSLASNVVV